MKQKSVEVGWSDFLVFCSKIKTPEEFNNVFSLFSTYEERETMALCYVIVKALLDGPREAA